MKYNMNVDEKILAAFYKAGSEPIPASQLAAQTGISNVVLAERIESLTKWGYVIEKHPHAGCRLLEAPDRLLVDDLQARVACIFYTRTEIVGQAARLPGCTEWQAGPPALQFGKTPCRGFSSACKIYGLRPLDLRNGMG